MLKNIRKVIKKYFWPTLTSNTIMLNSNVRVESLSSPQKNSFFMELQKQIKGIVYTRKGLIAVNIVGFVYNWEILPFLVVGSLGYLFLISKKASRLPEKIFNKLDIQIPYTKKDNKNILERDFNYDPSKINVEDLQIGFLLDYNLQTYKVVEHFQYVTEDTNCEEKLVLITGIDERYIFKKYNVNNPFIRSTQKINIFSIDENLDTEILLKQRPKSVITYKGTNYYRDEESKGSIHSFKSNTIENRFKKWDYFDDSRLLYICIEQIDTNKFVAYQGKIEAEIAFSEILPQK
ncbi:DUF4178 domain-containing protein [Flammeovirga pectinis]|uniref:DUF4178 domain-containing protein n=2 Tax=Flammeovirga pectinis TaxID=2494373 RepID=A0A3Q9FP12_9BACT|nr:DUF4178 domain-containing protein [Flammeovirga pectinis]